MRTRTTGAAETQARRARHRAHLQRGSLNVFRISSALLVWSPAAPAVSIAVRRFVPWALLGLLVLGTALGIGLGVAAQPGVTAPGWVFRVLADTSFLIGHAWTG